MMHDWSLISITIDWLKGLVTITLKNSRSEEVFLRAEGFVDLKVPKYDSWGESMSVNTVEGPSKLDDGNWCLRMEIQSGDTIELLARTITIPES